MAGAALAPRGGTPPVHRPRYHRRGMTTAAFALSGAYAPTGDQPQAIAEIGKGLGRGERFQTLLGVTGSGKTFTMANIIAGSSRPALVIAHNKTLAAALQRVPRAPALGGGR